MSYTDADAEVVAEVAAAALGLEPWQVRLTARAVLSALLADGWQKLPADTEIRPEWGWLPAGGRDPAVFTEAGARWFTEHGHSGTVMRRWRAVGPWQPVPTDPPAPTP